MRRDEGFTLIELLVALSLLVLGITMFGSSLVVVGRNVDTQLERGANLASLRLALATMESQVRSGVVAGVDLDGRRAIVYTDASGERKCVGWLVHPASGIQGLYVASWSPGAVPPPAGAPDWRLVAGGIRNAQMPVGFRVPPFSAKMVEVVSRPRVMAGLSLGVQLWVSNDLKLRLARVPVESSGVASTFTARNINRGGLLLPDGVTYLAQACT